MDLKLVKGTDINKYVTQATADEYEGALFFDLKTKRIYITEANDDNTIKVTAMDSNVHIASDTDDNGHQHYSLQFIQDDGNIVTISEVQIPSIDSDISLDSVMPGLMTGVDKYMLDNIAAALNANVVIDEAGVAHFSLGTNVNKKSTVDNIEELYDKDVFKNIAYKGMIITVLTPSIYGITSTWVLIDPSPYNNNSDYITLNADTFQHYWKQLQSIMTWYDYDDENVDEVVTL